MGLILEMLINYFVFYSEIKEEPAGVPMAVFL